MMKARVLAVWLVGVACAGLSATPLVAEEGTVPSFSAAGDHEASQRILEALRKPLPEAGLDFSGTALEEVVATLRDEYKIQILFDKSALEDLGIDQTQPVDVNLRNTSLQAALTLMLKELELTHVVADEVLLITTQEEADTRLSICVYPVRDLIDPNYTLTEANKRNGPSTKARSTPVELIPITDALISTVASDTWAENGGGEAEIRALRPGLLVVSQTQAVHDEIRNTLAAIRRGKQFAQENQTAPEQVAEGRMGRGYGGEMMGYGGGYGGYGAGRGFRDEGGYGREVQPAEKAEGDPFGPGAEPSKKAKAGEDPFAE